jgi:hypothetical protein
MIPKLIPFPMMIDPKKAVFEFSSLTLNGGRDAKANERTAAMRSGGMSTNSARHHRK